MDILKLFLIIFFTPIIVIGLIVGLGYLLFNYFGEVGVGIATFLFFWGVVSYVLALDIKK